MMDSDFEIPRENDTLLTNFDSKLLPKYQEAIKRYDRKRGVRWWRPMKPLLRISAFAYYRNSLQRADWMHSLHLCVGRSEAESLDGFWDIYHSLLAEGEQTK